MRKWVVLKGVVERVNFPKEKVEYIFYGSTIHAEIGKDAYVSRSSGSFTGRVPVHNAVIDIGSRLLC